MFHAKKKLKTHHLLRAETQILINCSNFEQKHFAITLIHLHFQVLFHSDGFGKFIKNFNFNYLMKASVSI